MVYGVNKQQATTVKSCGTSTMETFDSVILITKIDEK